MNEMTIWKYHLVRKGAIDIQIPKGARVLTIQTQGDLPCLWILVNPSNELETRTFEVMHTGEIFNLDGLHYIGTYQLFSESEVCHLFEIMEKDGFIGGGD